MNRRRSEGRDSLEGMLCSRIPINYQERRVGVTQHRLVRALVGWVGVVAALAMVASSACNGSPAAPSPPAATPPTSAPTSPRTVAGSWTNLPSTQGSCNEENGITVCVSLSIVETRVNARLVQDGTNVSGTVTVDSVQVFVRGS